MDSHEKSAQNSKHAPVLLDNNDSPSKQPISNYIDHWLATFFTHYPHTHNPDSVLEIVKSFHKIRNVEKDAPWECLLSGLTYHRLKADGLPISWIFLQRTMKINQTQATFCLEWIYKQKYLLAPKQNPTIIINAMQESGAILPRVAKIGKKFMDLISKTGIFVDYPPRIQAAAVLYLASNLSGQYISRGAIAKQLIAGPRAINAPIRCLSKEKEISIFLDDSGQNPFTLTLNNEQLYTSLPLNKEFRKNGKQFRYLLTTLYKVEFTREGATFWLDRPQGNTLGMYANKTLIFKIFHPSKMFHQLILTTPEILDVFFLRVYGLRPMEILIQYASTKDRWNLKSCKIKTDRFLTLL